jgi:hypothetical protein
MAVSSTDRTAAEVSTPAEFKEFLARVCAELTDAMRRDATLHTSAGFQTAVGDTLEALAAGTAFALTGKAHPHIFPDFSLGEFGVEVKFTKNDTWRSVANSVFEGQRSEAVRHIYIVFGKVGGTPEVRFARYDDCIIHVRTSHVPRFEVDVTATESLFETTLGITYEEFSQLRDAEKMEYIRRYARSRLKEGERLWWLGDEDDEVDDGSTHTVPLGARLYTTLGMDEKLQVSAEAALLCPRIVAPSRSKKKYDDVALYLITYHGILAHQARDLFSAGSAADRRNATPDENHVRSALRALEPEMQSAAETLPMALFEEYWRESPEPSTRITRWLEKADEHAVGWTPSEDLFQ